MINNLGLSFGLLIALFVPGFILLASIFINFYGINTFSGNNLKELLSSIKEPNVFTLFIITIISFIFGLLLDSVRYLITIIIQTILKSEIDFSLFKEEDRKYLDWVVENNFRFHQFYSNVCLGLLLSAVLLNSTFNFWQLLPVYSSIIICLAAAILSFKKTLDSLNKRITLIKKEEQS
jgi:hypothetical protein